MHLAEKYVSNVEVLFNGKRTIPPHAAVFYGRPLKIVVKVEPRKEEFVLGCHTNMSIATVKTRIADKLCVPVSSLTTVSIETGNIIYLHTNHTACIFLLMRIFTITLLTSEKKQINVKTWELFTSNKTKSSVH